MRKEKEILREKSLCFSRLNVASHSLRFTSALSLSLSAICVLLPGYRKKKSYAAICRRHSFII